MLGTKRDQQPKIQPAHRSRSGVAVSFVSAASEAHFRLIEKRHGIRLEREVLPGFEPSATAPLVPTSGGGVKGKRKSKKDRLREAKVYSATSS
jgi:superfamily II DNA/RNA helicase